MRALIVVISMCIVVGAHAQDDYRIYHRCINNAERCFFLEGKTDSAYRYYDMAFSKFDFVFAKDCFMAAQIACYNKSDKYISYLKKGFKNGLRPDHLKYSRVLVSLTKDSIAFNKKFSDYKELRKVYLKRINVIVLKQVIKHVSLDQSEKNFRYSDNDWEGENTYAKKLEKHLNFMASLIKQIGFPGDKLNGIDQEDILNELGHDSSDYIDLYNLIYKDPKYHTQRGQFEICDGCISQEHVFALLYHQNCAYGLFSKDWEKLIISGEIHPRDVAMLYDEFAGLYYKNADQVRSNKIAEIYECGRVHLQGCYKTDQFTDYKIPNCSAHITDSLRVALYINTLAVDSAKTSFGAMHGFKTQFGFRNCR
jgi:hypothetical protein